MNRFGAVIAFLVLACASAGPEVRRNLRGQTTGPKRGLRGMDVNLFFRQGVATMMHQGAVLAESVHLVEDDGGTPAKQVNTTASGTNLVEELLSHKKLTKEVRLTPTRNGFIKDGRIFDIFLQDADVGDKTRVYVGEDGNVHFDIEDLNVGVECNYDMRLTSLKFGETGSVKARLKGPGMTLRFPKEGSGPGSCYFKPGLDLDVLEAHSDRDAINAGIGGALRSNMMGIRSEIVEEMEDGLCRALLAGPDVSDAAQAPLPLPEPRSMWPLVIGAVLLLLLFLVLAFFLGRCSAQDWSQSKATRSFCAVEDEEAGTSDSDAGMDGIQNSNCEEVRPVTVSTALGDILHSYKPERAGRKN